MLLKGGSGADARFGLVCLDRQTGQELWRTNQEELSKSHVNASPVIEGGLVLCAAPTVLRAFGRSGLALLCQETLAILAPGGPVVGWLTAGLSVAIATAATASIIKARREERTVRIEAGLGLHNRKTLYELVVLPTTANVAVSVGGTPQSPIDDACYH